MIEAQNIEFHELIRTQAIVDNDDPVGAYGDANPLSVDTAGADYAVVLFEVGATDIAIAASVYHGTAAASGADDSDYTKITGSDVAIAADGDNTLHGVFIDLRNKERYLAAECLVGDGTAGGFITCKVLLFRNKQNPSTASARGLASQVFV